MNSVRWEIPRINPIIVREVRTRMRGGRPYVILTGFLIALILVGIGIYFLMLQQQRNGGTVLSPQLGQALFYGMSLSQLLLIVFLAPAMTSGSISSEHEQLTYEMLIATPLRAGQLLWGKLISALLYLFLLVFTSLPLFSVVLIFGGVQPLALIKVVILLVLATITAGSIGLFCSALFKRTARATIMSYVLILLMIGGTSIFASLWTQFNPNSMGNPAPPPVLYLNPFSALTSITTTAPRTDGTIVIGDNNPLQWIPFLNALGPSPMYYGNQGPVVVPIYRASYLIYSGLTILLLWISAHLVQPRRRWMPQVSDIGFMLAWFGWLGVMWLTANWWYIIVTIDGPFGFGGVRM